MLLAFSQSHACYGEGYYRISDDTFGKRERNKMLKAVRKAAEAQALGNCERQKGCDCKVLGSESHWEQGRLATFYLTGTAFAGSKDD